MTISIKHHTFVAGITGGGKTYLIENYLSRFPKVIKLDSKGEALDNVEDGKNPWEQVHPKELVIVEKLEDVMKAQEPYIIYCPVFDELNFDAFNDFFWYVYHDRKGKDTVTWVDELMEVSKSSQTIPDGLRALYTKGRSRRTPVWAASQRPKDVQPICLSQSTHVFAFDMPLPQDREQLAKATGAPEFQQLPGGYNFWYFQRGWRSAVKGVIG